MKIYAVGVMTADLSENPRSFIKEQRLWYMFANFEDAEKCVLQNESDIFEYSYNLALIEEIYLIGSKTSDEEKEAGWTVPKQWWYYADYSQGAESEPYPIVTKIDTPKTVENVCCFWCG
jgi:hypothetical protein